MVPDPLVPRRSPAPVYWLLQPTLMVAVVVAWVLQPGSLAPYLFGLIGVHLALGLAEWLWPARPGWVPTIGVLGTNLAMVLVLLVCSGAITELYASELAAPLANVRDMLGLDVWPHHWPLLVQLFCVFFLSEFIWYWLHRAEHRWALVWRLSGHGAHHAFKRLSALNFGLNHPFELFLIALPSALVELLFGVGPAAAGSALLAVTLASIAHANVSLNTRVIGWLFTTNTYHLLHHSSVLEDSNTNFGCSAIVWDRLFGTFRHADVADAGIGPTEPTTWQKLLMPLRDPEDSAVSPLR